MESAEIFESQAGYVFGAFNDMFVAVWRETTTKAAAARLSGSLERFAAKHKAGIVMIVVIEPTCEMPDAEVRDVMARDMKRHEGFTKQMMLVYEGVGFRAAVVRSVVVGMQMMSRQAVPTKTVATIEDGARWLEAQSGARARDVETAVREIRKATQPSA